MFRSLIFQYVLQCCEFFGKLNLSRDIDISSFFNYNVFFFVIYLYQSEGSTFLKKLREQRWGAMYVYNKNVPFSVKFFPNVPCPPVSYRMVVFELLKMVGSKWKYGRHINVTETASTGKSIAITPEAFKNENYETQ